MLGVILRRIGSALPVLLIVSLITFGLMRLIPGDPAAAMAGLSATQHAMSNPITAVAADAATCRMYIQAHHVLDPDDPDSWFTLGGYYDDRLVRDPGAPAGWVLTAVRLTVLWRRGDPGIMPIARQRGLDAR